VRTIQIKRAYAAPEDSDGYRMLVDRLWPRGLKKEFARLDEWNKAVTPSIDLRKWFGHKPENFERFAELYRAELATKLPELHRVRGLSKKQTLTLVYAAKDENINHARILRDVLINLKD
jgi:uncharacterized protein YeaO (DUF488 family)